MESEKERVRLEIIKEKKRHMIFEITAVLLVFAALTSSIIGVLIYDNNRVFSIICLSICGVLFIGLFIILPLHSNTHNNKMKDMVSKFTGSVSDTDKELAKTLEVKWKAYYPDMKKWKFDFLGEQDYEGFEEIISNILGGIELGVKGEEDSYFEIVYNDFNELQNKNELDERTKEIIKLLFDILDLIKRNSYSLKDIKN